MSRLLRLTLLAPDIQEALLEGRQPKALQLDELMGAAMPAEWEEQRVRGGGATEPWLTSAIIFDKAASSMPHLG